MQVKHQSSDVAQATGLESQGTLFQDEIELVNSSKRRKKKAIYIGDLVPQTEEKKTELLILEHNLIRRPFDFPLPPARSLTLQRLLEACFRPEVYATFKKDTRSLLIKKSVVLPATYKPKAALIKLNQIISDAKQYASWYRLNADQIGNLNLSYKVFDVSLFSTFAITHQNDIEVKINNDWVDVFSKLMDTRSIHVKAEEFECLSPRARNLALTIAKAQMDRSELILTVDNIIDICDCEELVDRSYSYVRKTMLTPIQKELVDKVHEFTFQAYDRDKNGVKKVIFFFKSNQEINKQKKEEEKEYPFEKHLKLLGVQPAYIVNIIRDRIRKELWSIDLINASIEYTYDFLRKKGGSGKNTPAGYFRKTLEEGWAKSKMDDYLLRNDHYPLPEVYDPEIKRGDTQVHINTAQCKNVSDNADEVKFKQLFKRAFGSSTNELLEYLTKKVPFAVFIDDLEGSKNNKELFNQIMQFATEYFIKNEDPFIQECLKTKFGAATIPDRAYLLANQKFMRDFMLIALKNSFVMPTDSCLLLKEIYKK